MMTRNEGQLQSYLEGLRDGKKKVKTPKEELLIELAEMCIDSVCCDINGIHTLEALELINKLQELK